MTIGEFKKKLSEENMPDDAEMQFWLHKSGVIQLDDIVSQNDGQWLEMRFHNPTVTIGHCIVVK